MTCAAGTWVAFAGVFFLIAAPPISAGAEPAVVADEACAHAPVDVASFATCIDGRVATPQGSVDARNVTPGKRTKSARYLYATEAYVAKRLHADSTLLVDVRPAGEATRSGEIAIVDAAIPYDGDAGAFARSVKAALGEHRIGNGDTIVLICRDGTLAARASDALLEAASIEAYIVVDGFDPAFDPARPPYENGWKRAGLPWRAAVSASR